MIRVSQSQNLIYYTTAQVTDMVELSDQNVRKYVRLLEDREYEVAKDEHNRRLFSKKDVSILQEMIKVAKSPGNTLDSAADEIILNMGDFEEPDHENQVAKMSDNDVSRMLVLVLEKLEEIQNENKELKTNIGTLVKRLEDYDITALEYNPVEKVETSVVNEKVEEEAPQVTETAAETEEQELAEQETETSTEENTSIEAAKIESEEVIPVEEASAEEAVETAGTIEESVEEDIEETGQTEPVEEVLANTAAENKGTIDLSKQEEVAEEPEEELNQDETAKQQIEEPKKGFFGKLASMFKG